MAGSPAPSKFPKESQFYVHVSEASPTVFENNALFMAINALKPLENI